LLIIPQYPGSPSYPSQDEWNTLNQTLKGKLVHGIPAAHVCYPPREGEAGILNTTACSDVAGQLLEETFNAEQAVDINVRFWGGNQCPPVLSPNGTCGQGNFSDFVVLAESAYDVSVAVKFANKYNLRLICKNSGHDFLGR